MRAWLAIAVMGAIVCTICDHLHVITGVLYYPKPFFWQQAWWVPPLFAGASVVITASAQPTRALLGGAVVPPPLLRCTAGDMLAFVTAYAFTAYGNSLPNVVLAVLVAWWLARVVAGAPPWLVVYSLLTAAGGTLFEAGWSKLGFFHYSNPDFIGVPRWLPGIYLHVAFLTADLSTYVQPRRALAISRG